jgi:hypothetical protein
MHHLDNSFTHLFDTDTKHVLTINTVTGELIARQPLAEKPTKAQYADAQYLIDNPKRPKMVGRPAKLVVNNDWRLILKISRNHHSAFDSIVATCLTHSKYFDKGKFKVNISDVKRMLVQPAITSSLGLGCDSGNRLAAAATAHVMIRVAELCAQHLTNELQRQIERYATNDVELADDHEELHAA